MSRVGRFALFMVALVAWAACCVWMKVPDTLCGYFAGFAVATYFTTPTRQDQGEAA